MIRGERSGCWPPELRAYRNLVIDRDGTPVSWGLPKFHNWEMDAQASEAIEQALARGEPVECSEKLDGRLVIRSLRRGEPWLRSRSSWDLGPVQTRVEEWARGHAPPLLEAENAAELSLHLEWCDPENRVVLPHPHPSLQLIGARENKSGQLLERAELEGVAELLGLSISPLLPLPDSLRELQELVNQRPGEGAVVRAGSWMVRVKSQDYQLRHALRFEWTPQRVHSLWERGRLEGAMSELHPLLRAQLLERAQQYEQLESQTERELRALIQGDEPTNDGQRAARGPLRRDDQKGARVMLRAHLANRLYAQQDARTARPLKLA